MKESKSYYISVEGECEEYYFDFLKEQINNCEYATYKAHFVIAKKSPLSFAKTRNNIFAQKRKKTDGFIKYYHIQDIEDFYDNYQKNKFYNMIDEINEAKRLFKISVYKLGYSNFSFDMWMVLHKYNLTTPVSDRGQYYKYINIGYKKSYTNMDEYKAEDEFKGCLSILSLDDVLTAIERSKTIRQHHIDNNEYMETHGKFSFYRDNPDLTINEVVEEILIDCGVI